jgi:dTDP-glucose 4,6-dehydratase
MNKKIVYVTGCTGFIGSHVTRACLEQGWFVYGIDKMTYASNEKFLEEFYTYERFRFEQVDLCDIKRLYDCDYVINTAAETHVDNSIESSDAFVHSNINGVHNLLKLIANKRQRKPTLLHFSTDEVYGDIAEGSHNETDLLRPSNPYSATKAAADQLIIAWGRTHKVPWVIVRPTNNYGIGQYVEKLIPKTVKFLAVGRKIDLHNGGTPVRTWLHASDTAQAIMTIIGIGVKNEIFNISGNYETENLTVVKKILNQMLGHDQIEGFTEELVREGQDVRYSIDDSKLKALGWEPKANFDEELTKIIEYYKENFVW